MSDYHLIGRPRKAVLITQKLLHRSIRNADTCNRASHHDWMHHYQIPFSIKFILCFFHSRPYIARQFVSRDGARPVALLCDARSILM